MSNSSSHELATQRLALRAALRTQRLHIAAQLDPPLPVQRDFPRSATMRFLTRQPAIIAGIVTRFAPALLGPRVAQSALMAITLGKVARAFIRAV